jgi:hypothetical protein
LYRLRTRLAQPWRVRGDRNVRHEDKAMDRIEEQQHNQERTANDERKGAHQGGRMRQGEQEEERRRPVDVARLREVGRNLGAQLEEQARKRPYVVLGAAAGMGFIAGSLFGSRLGQAAIAAGMGYVAKNLLEGDVGVERLRENLERLAHERTKG